MPDVSVFGAPGRTTVVNVLAHSSCDGKASAPCPISALVTKPSAWTSTSGVTVTVLSNGNVSIAVGSSVAVDTTAAIHFSIHDKYGTASSTITLTIGAAPVTPNIGLSIYIGKSQTFDLMARIKCDDLTSPCPASALKGIVIGTDPKNPLVTGSATSAGSVTVKVDPKEPQFNVAHIPYKVTDKYGTSSGLLVVTVLDPYNPKSGVVFNNPMGSYYQVHNIYRRIVDMINHTPKGATIQMVNFTMDGVDIVGALERAYRRGVNVRLLRSEWLQDDSVAYLQGILGTDPRANSFYYICVYACRAGHSGQMHSKVFSVTQTGVAKNVVASSSTNISEGSDIQQWFDSYISVGNVDAFQTFAHIFSEERQDRQPTDWRGVSAQVSGSLWYLYPKVIRQLSEMTGEPMPAPIIAPARTNGDWAEIALSQIGCNASTGYGANGRTVVRVTNRAMQGARGYDLAVQLGQLEKAGCDVRVITAEPSTDVVRALKAAGIPVKDQTWRWQYGKCREGVKPVGTDHGCWWPGLFQHMHSLVVSGNYQNKQQTLVWTGSEGWNTDAYWNDENVVRMSGHGYYMQYLSVFNENWAKYTHASFLKPLGSPPASTATYP